MEEHVTCRHATALPTIRQKGRKNVKIRKNVNLFSCGCSWPKLDIAGLQPCRRRWCPHTWGRLFDRWTRFQMVMMTIPSGARLTPAAPANWDLALSAWTVRHQTLICIRKCRLFYNIFAARCRHLLCPQDSDCPEKTKCFEGEWVEVINRVKTMQLKKP